MSTGTDCVERWAVRCQDTRDVWKCHSCCGALKVAEEPCFTRVQLEFSMYFVVVPLYFIEPIARRPDP
ncbi:hypothetical protein ASG05_00015 [Frigoribacterium sp. Leaf186]|jgi:hypothetical protein|nr:hypothetical protein ASG05_00015 [Frigoribacterium sp. Leaf186]